MCSIKLETDVNDWYNSKRGTLLLLQNNADQHACINPFECDCNLLSCYIFQNNGYLGCVFCLVWGKNYHMKLTMNETMQNQKTKPLLFQVEPISWTVCVCVLPLYAAIQESYQCTSNAQRRRAVVTTEMIFLANQPEPYCNNSIELKFHNSMRTFSRLNACIDRWIQYFIKKFVVPFLGQYGNECCLNFKWVNNYKFPKKKKHFGDCTRVCVSFCWFKWKRNSSAIYFADVHEARLIFC